MKDAIFRVFAGTLGSYKSYHGVVECLDTLEQGGVVMTNIPLKWDRIKMFFEDEKGLILDDKQYVVITPEQAGHFVELLVKGEHKKPNKLVIDEAGLHHNTMDKRQMDRKVLEMIVHARKLHIDTVFIAHHFNEILAQIRNKAQSVLWFRDLEKIKFLGLTCPIPAYIFAEVDARNPKIKYDKALKWKNKRIYTFYVSHDVQSEAVKAIKEKPKIEMQKVDKPAKPTPVKNFAKRWARRAAFGALIAGATTFLTASEDNPSQEQPKPSTAPVAKQVANNPPSQAEIPTEPESLTYTSMGVNGAVEYRMNSRVPYRKDFCRYSSMTVTLSNGSVLNELDPKLFVRLHDGAIMYEGEIYKHAPITTDKPSNESFTSALEQFGI
ncbi:zonular occludens toxin domain-containing protein [Cerasicoccus frondis]|uniref:zonular occludens toxin domain-containing protein n=1 Tax=Cerasicoccus frondis TaxID=490090 RepID=UPI0028529245|nr:zonular occludens toxin domain-containing protein [Cerasicoccus frondis]